MKQLLIVIALMCATLTITAWATPQPQQWEYKFEFNIREKKANELGAQGWQLIAIGATGSGPVSNVETFVFKRAK